MGSGNPLSTLMHRMTVSSKSRNTMTSGSGKKLSNGTKRIEPVPGAHTNLRSQSKKRPSTGEVEQEDSEDDLVMVANVLDPRNGSYPEALPADQPAKPKKRRSNVQFYDDEVPKLEEEEKAATPSVAINRKFSMHDFAGILKILAGPGQFMFEFPRSILVRNSHFFQTACEAADYDARLAFDFTDIEPSIFTIYLSWLSSDHIEKAKEYIIVPHDLAKDELQRRSFQKRLQLIQLYVLGERLIDRAFKNQIMDNLITHCKFVHETFGPIDGLGNGARLVYEKTKSTSLLRRLVLENYFATGSFADCKPRAPGDRCDGECAVTEQFYLDLAKIGMRVVREKRAAPLPPWEQHGCYYHDHSDQDEGYTCKN